MSEPELGSGAGLPATGRPPVAEACPACGEVWLRRRGFCPRCGSAKTEVREVPGQGRVTAVTRVHRATQPSVMGPAPYNLVLVALDAHPEVVIMALARDEMQIGDRTEVSRHGDRGAPYLAICP